MFPRVIHPSAIRNPSQYAFSSVSIVSKNDSCFEYRVFTSDLDRWRIPPFRRISFTTVSDTWYLREIEAMLSPDLYASMIGCASDGVSLGVMCNLVVLTVTRKLSRVLKTLRQIPHNFTVPHWHLSQ
jgi:hypothetical protein